MARELASTRGRDNMPAVICRHVEDMFGGAATLWAWEQEDIRCLTHPEWNGDLKEKRAALFAYEHAQAAGLGTSTLAGAQGYYLPMKGSADVVDFLEPSW